MATIVEMGIRCPVLSNQVEDERGLIDQLFDPRVHKCPLIKEVAADAMAGRTAVSDKVSEHLPDVLYESVKKMIFKVANKYSITCMDDVNDLIQDCAYRVFSKIDQYDSSKGAFTTWVWRVCSSVLNRIYKRNKGYKKRFEEWDEESGKQIEDNRVMDTNGEVSSAIVELFDMYPEKRDILAEIFGETDDISVPKKINMSEIAKCIGRKHYEVYVFVSRKVRPFLIEKFGEIRYGD
jgi:RNA polymerase sigma factor (sigma-70 family)